MILQKRGERRQSRRLYGSEPTRCAADSQGSVDPPDTYQQLEDASCCVLSRFCCHLGTGVAIAVAMGADSHVCRTLRESVLLADVLGGGCPLHRHSLLGASHDDGECALKRLCLSVCLAWTVEVGLRAADTGDDRRLRGMDKWSRPRHNRSECKIRKRMGRRVIKKERREKTTGRLEEEKIEERRRMQKLKEKPIVVWKGDKVASTVSG